jgi:3-dehydroquinate dehydratase
MKTAVEWLIGQIKGYESDCEIFQQAKEMEKERIINATLYGFRQDSDGDDWEGDKHNAEKYYNETFKQQEQ